MVLLAPYINLQSFKICEIFNSYESKYRPDKSTVVVDLPQLDFEVLAVQVQDNSDDFGTSHSACLGKGDCGADGVLDSCLGFCHLAMRTVD